MRHGKRIAAVALLLLLGRLSSAEEDPRLTFTLESRVFGNTRTIRVLLPPGYDDPENARRRHPVFYFTDGVAAWDAWGVPQVAADLWSRKEIPEIIFVGIDNGGSTLESESPARDRAAEYLPYPDQTWTEDPPVPRGQKFPEFLFEEVMPLVNERFRTKPDGINTGLAGDSFAGAAALHTAMKYPGRLGFLLIESPSLHIGGGRLLREALAAGRWPPAVYLGVGTAEGETPEIRKRMVDSVRTVHARLEGMEDGPRVLLVVREGAEHWYDAWKERLPDALRFLLAGVGGEG